jgi:hypothetical protein
LNTVFDDYGDPIGIKKAEAPIQTTRGKLLIVMETRRNVALDQAATYFFNAKTGVGGFFSADLVKAIFEQLDKPEKDRKTFEQLLITTGLKHSPAPSE